MRAVAAEPRSATRIPHRLEHCEGFRVDSPDGRVGVVEEVLEGGILVVRVGLFGKRVLMIPPADVLDVEPRRERVVLGGAPRILASEGLEHWRSRAGRRGVPGIERASSAADADPRSPEPAGRGAGIGSRARSAARGARAVAAAPRNRRIR